MNSSQYTKFSNKTLMKHERYSIYLETPYFLKTRGNGKNFTLYGTQDIIPYFWPFKTSTLINS